MKTFAIQIVFILLCAAGIRAHAEQVTHNGNVAPLIKAFQSGDREAIAALIEYPLQRPSPSPPVNNAKDLLSRFDQIFDAALIKLIGESTPGDWEEVGWRGLMLDRGTVWINTAGKIIAINYQSEAEARYRQEINTSARNAPHPSLREFASPALSFRTKKFLIRIDKLANGKYRYAAWPAGKSTSEKPDLILENGDLRIEGTARNFYYDFHNGNYLYQCAITRVGPEGTPPVGLTVYRDKEIILDQPAVQIYFQ